MKVTKKKKKKKSPLKQRQLAGQRYGQHVRTAHVRIVLQELVEELDASEYGAESADWLRETIRQLTFFEAHFVGETRHLVGSQYQPPLTADAEGFTWLDRTYATRKFEESNGRV